LVAGPSEKGDHPELVSWTVNVNTARHAKQKEISSSWKQVKELLSVLKPQEAG